MVDKIGGLGGPDSVPPIQPVERPSDKEERRQPEPSPDKISIKPRSEKLDALYEELRKLDASKGLNWQAMQIDRNSILQEIAAEEKRLKGE